MFDAEKVKNDIIAWIREWFEINGKGCNAVIGISGGKDSSISLTEERPSLSIRKSRTPISLHSHPGY